MAKKNSRGAKRASKPLSSKAKSSRKYKLPAKSKATTRKKAKTAKKASAKRVSYKQEYIKLLEKTNKAFIKEIKAIRKAVEPVQADSVNTIPPGFPVTGTSVSRANVATINDVVEQLNAIQSEISQRNSMLQELMGQPGKI